jgi:predicted outer membrane protein
MTHCSHLLLGASVLIALTGCASMSSARGPQPAASQDDAVTPTESQTLSDGQIVHLLDIIDTDAITQAGVAKRRASEPQVRALAERAQVAHERSKQQTAAIAADAGLVPDRSDLADQVEASGVTLLQSLQSSELARVDQTYLGGLVEQQRVLLDTLARRLMPEVKNAALAARLGAVRWMIDSHLREADQLRQSLAPVTQPAQPPSRATADVVGR